MSQKRPGAAKAATEFIVIVVGVLVALAADGWRQDQADRRAEEQYLGRLSADLELGADQLASAHGRVQRLFAASETLIAATDDPATPDSVLVELFQQAAIAVLPVRRLTHDATYRELVTTGRLMIVQDADLRRQIGDYYRDVAFVTEFLAEVPTGIYDRFQQLTGYAPYAFQDDTACSYCNVPLTANIRERLLRELRDEPQLKRELRQLHGKLAFESVGNTGVGLFQGLEAKRQELAEALR